jgi:uncharacterized protein (TIGR02996 family)
MAQTAFLNAIRAQPEDDALRLVYADWLDEQGGASSAALAEFIRVQIRLAGLDEADPARDALEDRENELLCANERTWLGPLGGSLAAGLVDWRFERGFLGDARLDVDTLLLSGADLFERHPITRVRLGAVRTADVRPLVQLARSPWWSRVRGLQFYDESPLAVPTCAALLEGPHLTALSRLEITPREARVLAGNTPHVLARCPWLGGLEELHVNHWNRDGADLLPVLNGSSVRALHLTGSLFTSKGLAALLSGAYADHPCRVGLADGNLGANLWPALAVKSVKPILQRMSFTNIGRGANLDLPTLLSAPALANLNALDVGETRQSAPNVRALATSGFMTRATEIGLTRCYVSAKVMADLVKSPAPSLRVLKLGETGLRNKGVLALCGADWTDNLTHLDLMRNYLDDDAVCELARSGRFVNLRHLDLRVNSPHLSRNCTGSIGDTGAEVLASAPNLARLRSLNLYLTRVTVRGIDVLLNGPHWRLRELRIGGYDMGKGLPQLLAQAPQLARLTHLDLSHTPGLAGDALLPLAESPYLSPLCHLDLGHTSPSKRVRARLTERLGRRFEVFPPVSSW